MEGMGCGGVWMGVEGCGGGWRGVKGEKEGCERREGGVRRGVKGAERCGESGGGKGRRKR